MSGMSRSLLSTPPLSHTSDPSPENPWLRTGKRKSSSWPCVRLTKSAGARLAQQDVERPIAVGTERDKFAVG